jgi:hypothetical protein
MPFIPTRSIQSASLLRGVCLAPIVLAAFLSPPVQAQAHDMFPTKDAALKRAKELKCTGAFAMGKEWMPCKDFATYENAVRKNS